MLESKPTDELTFDVHQALRKARPFLGTRRSGTRDDDTLRLAAEDIVEHLTRCRWQFERLPPPRLHSTRATTAENESVETNPRPQ